MYPWSTRGAKRPHRRTHYRGLADCRCERRVIRRFAEYGQLHDNGNHHRHDVGIPTDRRQYGIPGAGNNNNGGLTITLDANVGHATADASNSRFSFGTCLDCSRCGEWHLCELGIHREIDDGQRGLQHGRQHGNDPGGHEQQRFGPNAQHGMANPDTWRKGYLATLWMLAAWR